MAVISTSKSQTASEVVVCPTDQSILILSNRNNERFDATCPYGHRWILERRTNANPTGIRLSVHLASPNYFERDDLPMATHRWTDPPPKGTN